MKQKYIELMEDRWGESEEVAQSLFLMLGKNEELYEEVVNKELIFNRYTCDVYTWRDLLETIINDEAFLEDNFFDDYIEEMSSYQDESDDKIKELLINQNWAIDTERDVAIGFDDTVKVINHEI